MMSPKEKEAMKKFHEGGMKTSTKTPSEKQKSMPKKVPKKSK